MLSILSELPLASFRQALSFFWHIKKTSLSKGWLVDPRLSLSKAPAMVRILRSVWGSAINSTSSLLYKWYWKVRLSVIIAIRDWGLFSSCKRFRFTRQIMALLPLFECFWKAWLRWLSRSVVKRSSYCTKTLSHLLDCDVHDQLLKVPHAALTILKCAKDCAVCNLQVTTLLTVQYFLKHATTSNALGQQPVMIHRRFPVVRPNLLIPNKISWTLREIWSLSRRYCLKMKNFGEPYKG